MKSLFATKHLCLVFLATLVLSACSVWKQKKFEKDVSTFIDQFEKNLGASDEVIMSQFRVEKSRSAILKAIAIMQNKRMDIDSVRCTINFAKPIVAMGENVTRIELLANHNTIDPQIQMDEQSIITLWLAYNEDDQLYISAFDGDKFYNSYKSMAYELASRRHRERDLARRNGYLRRAMQLQNQYDTVIWYTSYQDSVYYYVVNGEWNNYFLNDSNPKTQSYSMGLVSESGRVVVPAQYDLVGTVGFHKPGLVEVKKNGLVGLYDLGRGVIVDAEYEWLVPYLLSDSTTRISSDVFLLKRDTIYGWIDAETKFSEGYPSTEAATYMEEYGFLSKPVKIAGNTTTMTEILSIDEMGSGIVMPPDYLVRTNVMREIIPSIYTDDNSLGWGSLESIQTERSFFAKIKENLSAFIVMFTERYTEGREGFYTQSKLTFVDNNDNSLIQMRLQSGETTFRMIDSTLLELKIARSPEDVMSFLDYDEPVDDSELNLPLFEYFQVTGKTISRIEATRNYNFTEFVKLDSSYFKGKFLYWDGEKQTTGIRDFLSTQSIASIRNEILARHGFIFTDEKIRSKWTSRNWYKPRYSNYNEFINEMNEIDRYNLEFLEKIVVTLNKEVAV